MKYRHRVFSLFFISVLIVAIWLVYIDINETLEHLSSIDLKYLLIAIVFFLSAYICRSVRWHLILKSLTNMKYSETVMFYFSGLFLNQVIPFRGGDIVKCNLIKKRKHDISISGGMSSVFLEKIFDPIMILLAISLIATFLLFSKEMIYLMIVAASVLIALAVFMILIIFKEEYMIKISSKIAYFFPEYLKERITTIPERFSTGLKNIDKSKQNIFRMAFFTITGLALDGIYCFLIFTAFDTRVTFLIAFVGYALYSLSFIIPPLPGYIGTIEASWVFIFVGIFGLNKNLVAAVTIFIHTFMFLLISIIGLICLKLLTKNR